MNVTVVLCGVTSVILVISVFLKKSDSLSLVPQKVENQIKIHSNPPRSENCALQSQ